LILKKLEMQGFKSFADKIDMQFGDGVTGIVGPNGSGKSNISDAVRWVLGEQSAKQLRGGTMADVIFNGTEKRKQQQYCEVSLTFDNEDGSIASDYREIMVTRRVYRNGDSEYYLNKSACRLRDIVDIFRDTGIGKDGYSLIGQGRIDEILSAKSEDRRSIFEEAAGIVKFKARKTEAERRLEHAAQNLTRIDDIMGELEKSLGPLKEQSETARVYMRLTEQLKDLELAAFAAQFDAYHQKIETLEGQITEFETACAQNEAQEKEYEQAAQTLEDETRVLEEALAQLRVQVLEMTRASEAAQGEVQLILQQINTRTERKEALLAQQQQARHELNALDGGDSAALAEEKTQALRALCQKVTPQFMSGGRFEAAIERSLAVTAVWRIDMDEITGKSNSPNI